MPHAWQAVCSKPYPHSVAPVPGLTRRQMIKEGRKHQASTSYSPDLRPGIEQLGHLQHIWGHCWGVQRRLCCVDYVELDHRSVVVPCPVLYCWPRAALAPVNTAVAHWLHELLPGFLSIPVWRVAPRVGLGLRSPWFQITHSSAAECIWC
jgi:hypothetical protein